MSVQRKVCRKGCPWEHYHGCLHLHVLDSYPQTWIDMHQQLLVTVLCSCRIVSSPASSFTPLCQYNMTRAGSLQWHHFLLCHRLPSTAWLSPSAFVQHHPALMSTELQRGHTESYIRLAVLLSPVLLDVVVTFVML